MREDVFPLITSVVGQPVSLDAALAGSYAHRLRDYWSNLFQNHQFNMVMAKESRCTPALPTILATHNSWAFRAPRPDTVIRSGDVLEEGETREVNLDEKAIAMGYSADELRRTDGMDDEKLAEVLGLAMDRRAMELLFLVAEASATGLPVSTECQDAGDSSTHATPMEAMISGASLCLVANAAPEWKPAEREKKMRFPKLADTVRLMLMVANVVEQEALREKHPDIHEDEWCIKWLKTRGSVEVPEEEAKRVRRMAARHRWDEVTYEIYIHGHLRW
eukprot:gene34356-biopygen26805